MTIVLISLLDFESFPVRLLHALMEKNGLDVRSVFLKSAGYNPPTKEEMKILIDYIKSINPSMVGISVRTRYFKFVSEITKSIKQNLGVPVVWGGIHPTIAPEKCIEQADIICIGEGEQTLLELAYAVEGEKDYTKIRNLWVKDDGKIFKNEIRPLVENLDSIPFPDFSDKNKVYIEEGKIAGNMEDIRLNKIEFKFSYPVMTSRGCLFNCTYCANSFLRSLYKGKGGYTRRRSVANVIEELKLAKQQFKTLNSVTFGDDVFSFDYGWLKAFAEEYKRQINLPFFTMFNPSMVDEKSVRLLKEMGLVNVQMGIQSGSERIRKKYYHRFNSDNQIREAMRIFRKYKLKASCDLILGNVFESEKDRMDTLELLLSLPKPYRLHCFCMNYFPNYTFTGMALERGLISENDTMDNLPFERQSFGKQFDMNRVPELLFWESIYKLATFKIFPPFLTRKLSGFSKLRSNPKPLIILSKILLKGRYFYEGGDYLARNLSSPRLVYSKIKQKLSKAHALA